MIEQLKRLGIGTLIFAVVLLAASAILVPLAYLVTCHPNWFVLVVFLFIGWLIGSIMRSTD